VQASELVARDDVAEDQVALVGVFLFQSVEI
jgi:hypothetical protein